MTVQVVSTILGRMQQQVRCPTCGGTGSVVEKYCGSCDGKGVNKKSKQLTITIPPGVEDSNRGVGAASRVTPLVPTSELMMKAKEQAGVTRESKQGVTHTELRSELRELRALVEAQAKGMQEQAKGMAAMQAMLATLLQKQPA